MDDDSHKATLDRELDRLHKLVEAGKEIGWATKRIEWLQTVIFQPPYIIPESALGEVKRR
jgi:hypothetical protein